MPKIKKLSNEQARKIAAGEVVERPVNVIKELIENSIDANAKNISIFLKDAGKKLIKIVDDGCGMSIEDARLCFEQHATSKINSIEDLNSLQSFGFRGEALSSISAVSKVKLLTKEKKTEFGSCITLHDGKIIKEEIISCSNGTDFEISDLFYNVPARLKFLKKSETEWRQILLLFQAFCLSNINIHFKLYHDDKEVFNCPTVQDLQSRIVQLWDYNLAQNLIECEIDDKNINLKIDGLISRHDYSKFNKNQIFFFVNRRWIKNYSLCKSLLKGYQNVLQEGKFPAAFIFLNSCSTLIDVNIHPKKEEVQFLHAQKIESILQNLIKKTLENHLSNYLNKDIQINSQHVNANKFTPAISTTFDFEQLPFFEPVDSFNAEGHTITQSSNSLFENKEEKKIFMQSQTNLEIDKNLKIIGQFNKTYILLEKEEGVFIIDQHAAHERILYELFSKKFNEVATVKLIFPNIISLSEQELNILEPYLEILHSNGIEADRFSKDQIVIKSTPVHIKNIILDDLLRQIISWIEENQMIERNEFFKLIHEKIRAQMACKAAIKAGDQITSEQMVQLLNDLQHAENNFTCPHGRPTGWLLPILEIEKKFKRKL